ncbi:hypothetical protein PR202_gb02411 [Eleusine coracana subsp. coracana]|uniref:Uncharacterized protein n=1 Tax=Eleusine coracana subsp. coracana TaxID=191504 RepID=A0AAV5E020_ELECO|nr:hypothetical protein PR202_gb02411 [Eleusine coracana subsp. coracana]
MEVETVVKAAVSSVLVMSAAGDEFTADDLAAADQLVQLSVSGGGEEEACSSSALSSPRSVNNTDGGWWRRRETMRIMRGWWIGGRGSGTGWCRSSTPPRGRWSASPIMQAATMAASGRAPAGTGSGWGIDELSNPLLGLN